MVTKRGSSDRVGKKIGHLVDEGKPKKQAVAMAMNMEKEGRLTAEGGYKRAGKKSSSPKGKGKKS